MSPGAGLRHIRRAGQLSRFLRSLSAYAERMRLLLFSYLDESLHEYTTDERLLERACIVGSTWRGGARGFSYWSPLRWARALRRCDALLVWHAIGGVPALAWRAVTGTPYVPVYDYAYADFTRLTGRRLRALAVGQAERVIATGATRIICHSPAMMERLPACARRKAMVIPTPIDTDVFSPAGEAVALTAGGLFVGRLEPQKNLVSLLEAWKQAADDLPLTVIGDGSLRAALEARASALNLTVRFVGTVPNEALPGHYRAAAFFVLPSLIEGLPKSLLEAMSCALPCLGTPVPGIGDLLEDGVTGIISTGTSAAGIATGLRRLREAWPNAGMMGARARAHVVEKHSFEAVTAQEIALLLEVLHARR